MKKIITLIMSILIISVLAGCGIMGMGSKSWIEKQVSDIEKVYPTENPEDLFEKFLNGFRIEQIRLFKENRVAYRLEMEIKGNKDTKKIEGIIKKVQIESSPYKETIVKEKGFSFETGRYNIKYLFTNKEIDNYLGLNKKKVSFDIRGEYSEKDKTYFHTIIIKDDTKKTNFSEKVVEERGDK